MSYQLKSCHVFHKKMLSNDNIIHSLIKTAFRNFLIRIYSVKTEFWSKNLILVQSIQRIYKFSVFVLVWKYTHFLFYLCFPLIATLHSIKKWTLSCWHYSFAFQETSQFFLFQCCRCTASPSYVMHVLY